jgi:hypothetical protein
VKVPAQLPTAAPEQDRPKRWHVPLVSALSLASANSQCLRPLAGPPRTNLLTRAQFEDLNRAAHSCSLVHSTLSHCRVATSRMQMTMADFFEFVRHSTLLAGNLTIAKAVHV